jgi:hypothetical protein
MCTSVRSLLPGDAPITPCWRPHESASKSRRASNGPESGPIGQSQAQTGCTPGAPRQSFTRGKPLNQLGPSCDYESVGRAFESPGAHQLIC